MRSDASARQRWLMSADTERIHVGGGNRAAKVQARPKWCQVESARRLADSLTKRAYANAAK
jgi:hypothetical protein